MVLYGLVEILKLKSKPLMNGRGYGVRSGRGYGVMAFKSEQSLSQSVTKVGIELLGQLKNWVGKSDGWILYVRWVGRSGG